MQSVFIKLCKLSDEDTNLNEKQIPEPWGVYSLEILKEIICALTQLHSHSDFKKNLEKNIMQF